MILAHGDLLESCTDPSFQLCLKCAASKPYVLATMNMPLLGAHGRVMEPLNMLLVMKRHTPNSCVFKWFPLCKMRCNFFAEV